MKIIQIISNITGSGATAYFMTLHRALRELGHDVVVYKFSKLDQMSFSTNELNIEQRELNTETYSDINKADLIFIEGLPHKKETLEYKNEFIDMIENHITKTKVLFIHSHVYASWGKPNYTERLLTKEFLMSIDKFCSFDPKNAVLTRFGKVIGQDEIEKRFVKMLHPYYFDNNLWIDANEKQKKISYFGRLVRIKDPERFIEMRETLWDNEWQMEMRGVVKTIGGLSFKNFIKHWDEETNTQTNEKSRCTAFISNALREKYGCVKGDKLCIDFNTLDRKIFCHGRYDINDGLKVISYQAFGADFYNLVNKLYGDNVEYAIFDIIKAGTIPVLDYEMGDYVRIFKDGVMTDKTLLSENAGVFLKKDLSNIDEVVSQMNNLYNDKEYYDRFRKNCYDIYKAMANPKEIVKKLLKDITT